ncbi:protein TIC 100 [Senna tora]|uniref:Protein TIC 100 n=1 Tax=Senna tora TaxID=362788 RepID=A0A834SL21_9FABA|nr:protein TIC 100 [Senna tora]
MANGDSANNGTDSQQEQVKRNDQQQDPNASSEDSDSDSESESSYESSYDGEYEGGDEVRDGLAYRRTPEELAQLQNTPEANFELFSEVLDSKRLKRIQEERDQEILEEDDPFDFPKDPENWREQDLGEFWADGPLEIEGTGWDPVWADEDEWEYVQDEIAAGRKPPIAPFYVPFRKYNPSIPDNHFDLRKPKAVIEELDRIEEFLRWVSYIFPDGSSYEGTVWDDNAHGKGVYVSPQELVRYEGEWLQNDMEGHGVVEVDIPDIEPVPGSKLEAKMRAEGKIISRDFMSPEDREWLEMDIEDSYNLADGTYEIPFYENDEWVKQFGRKPEKGRYRYAGQWKHGRMHGCGVYEVNERTIYGRFYFGELLDDTDGCDDETSALHAGIAEVAAAKARMFVNKPDGMVREERGPYSDPQHPYFYEEEDVWMAPGFINQFYEVPDYWKTYVHEVDQEREMWLNSFYKAPLRIPMPAELEYWWSKYETPEFVLVNKEPEPDPEDPSKLIYTEDPLILHTPTGHLINYVEDEENGIRLFWQPPLKKDEDVDPEKAHFLPLGLDEFFGREKQGENDGMLMRLVLSVENAFKPLFNKLEKWTEEQKTNSEMKKKGLEKELELVEAELRLEEAVADLDELLRRREKEEEEKVEMGLPEEDTASVTNKDEEAPLAEEEVEVEEGEEEEEDEEDEDDNAQSSFGSIEQEQTTDRPKDNKPGKSPFSTSSLSFASSSLVSGVPFKLQNPFSLLKKDKSKSELVAPLRIDSFSDLKTVHFRQVIGQKGSLKAVGQIQGRVKARSHSNGKSFQVCSLSRAQCRSLGSTNSKSILKEARTKGDIWLHAAPDRDLDSILSLHTPLYNLKHIETPCVDPAPLDLNIHGQVPCKSKYLHIQLNQPGEKNER